MEWVFKATPRPLYLREWDPVPMVQKAGCASGPSGRVGEISPSPGLAIRTVQAVASCYTSWAIPAAIIIVKTKRNTIITDVGEIKSYLTAVQVVNIVQKILTDSIEESSEETNIRSAD